MPLPVYVRSCGFSLSWLTSKIPQCSSLTGMAFSFSSQLFFSFLFLSFFQSPFVYKSRLSSLSVLSLLNSTMVKSFAHPFHVNVTHSFCEDFFFLFSQNWALFSFTLIKPSLLNCRMLFPPRYINHNKASSASLVPNTAGLPAPLCSGVVHQSSTFSSDSG